MKKYFLLPLALFALACNSNSDKVSDEAPEKTSITDTTAGNGLLSGNYQIVEYKKDNKKVDLIKRNVVFTKSGNVLKWDGNSFSYKIVGDTLEFYFPPSTPISKSKIEFLSPDKSSFVVTNSIEKTEYTYKKLN